MYTVPKRASTNCAIQHSGASFYVYRTYENARAAARLAGNDRENTEVCRSFRRRAVFHGSDASRAGLFRISRLSLGATLTNVLKQTEQKLADVNVTHDGPALFQEITWWPSNVPGASYKSDSVERILFSFHNGTLYKMSERTIHTTVYFGFKQNRLVEDAGGWRQIVEF